MDTTLTVGADGKFAGLVVPALAMRGIDSTTLGEQATPMQPMFEHYDRVGLRGNPLTLRAILGREPRTLRTFFQELAAEPPR